MDIRVLGPLTAEERGTSIVPSAGKPRQILALLAVCANEVVPVPKLIEEIWGAQMPRSAMTTLQTYILQLRRLLAGALPPQSPVTAKDVLVTRHGGYLLALPPESVDVQVYDRLVSEGRTAFESGDDRTASAVYRRALGIWRGTALVDVQVGPILDIELARLEESRLGVLERRIEAELRLGLHAELLTELIGLTKRHQLHEGLHAQCMTALFRSGRRWQALEIFQELRKRLVRELGLEPSPRLQLIHQAVLSGDPGLDFADGGVRARRIPASASPAA
ncbi:AfsR/SARP family transcriptional regulator [Streptomyces sp. HD]|uniref:AfsR/SARP family transcriptional regulator n=1 Tax=Streptomyces sp. HD TaxID=3020892 RepID=UPI00232E154A|nr:AfsR/SARP family transcriptional regulator [Streptomyces sp. HD]MDC0772590.1 AfsR/SARP family transcriptional regulator [Streptomyces sp. HD]